MRLWLLKWVYRLVGDQSFRHLYQVLQQRDKEFRRLKRHLETKRAECSAAEKDRLILQQDVKELERQLQKERASNRNIWDSHHEAVKCGTHFLNKWHRATAACQRFALRQKELERRMRRLQGEESWARMQRHWAESKKTRLENDLQHVKAWAEHLEWELIDKGVTLEKFMSATQRLRGELSVVERSPSEKQMAEQIGGLLVRCGRERGDVMRLRGDLDAANEKVRQLRAMVEKLQRERV